MFTGIVSGQGYIHRIKNMSTMPRLRLRRPQVSLKILNVEPVLQSMGSA